MRIRKLLPAFAGIGILLFGNLAALGAPADSAGPVGTDTGLAGAPSLAEVVDAAYRRYPARGVLDPRRREAQALTRQADSPIAGNPAVSVDHWTDQVGSGPGQREWEAGVELPLWRPGQKDARRSLAQSSVEQVTRGDRALRLEVAGEVRERTWAAYLARNRMMQARKEWKTATKLQADIEKRVRLGELAKTDRILAQEETLRFHSAYVDAKTTYANALDRYQRFTGLSQLPSNPKEARSARETLAAGQHPALAHQAAALRTAHAGIAVAREERADSPTLIIGARSERAAAGASSINSLGVSFRLPFGLDAHSRPKIAKAQVQAARAQGDYAQGKRDLEQALAQARKDLAGLRERLTMAEEQRDLAEENLRLARTAFSLGETDLVHLLRIQALTFNAQRDAQQLEIKLQRAVARYNQAVGELP